ncbi:MAG TPA: ABC transporter permease [Candidatus Gallacutalibacter stercoravium]|nr:ABC transporter permease [Candidatus Gallacutalibacter stercoravium]
MNFFSLIGVEFKKIRRSKILLILLIPVIIMWIPSIINADMNFDTRGIPITPENNFFIQGFMGMVWFMIPASLVVCTVLLIQTERANKGILKMLSLPVNTAKLCLAKFAVLILLAFAQMVMTIAAYYICAAIVSQMQNYNFFLDPLYVCRVTLSIYAGAIPMAAVFWMIANLITTPVFSVGIGLASIVPSVLIINTKIWFAYPMSYPFYLLMVEYGRCAEGIYETQIAWLPWLPAAALITVVALGIACVRFGAAERR